MRYFLSHTFLRVKCLMTENNKTYLELPQVNVLSLRSLVAVIAEEIATPKAGFRE